MNPTSPVFDRPFVLFVDDEPLCLQCFASIIGQEFNIYTAPTPEVAEEILRQHASRISIIVADQCMQGKRGTELLQSVRKKYPDIVRILTTSLSDIETAISAINESAIFQYIKKPWEPLLLLQTLRAAAEHHRLATERERLLNEKAVIMRHLVASDRLTSYETLAEGINHHIRNALVPVQSYVQMTSEYFEPRQSGSAEADFLSSLGEEAKNQLQSIINILSQLGSVPIGGNVAQRDQIQIEKLWHEVLNYSSAALVGKSIFVHLRVATALPPVRTSEECLRQIIEMILMNQINLMPVAGKVTVRLLFKPDNAGAPSHIRMEVTNDGPDIPTDRLASVFTPFFIHGSNPQDAGMELVSCYTTLHSLGGWTHAYNDRAKGTVLIFCLPVDPDNPSAYSTMSEEVAESSPAPAIRQTHAA